MISSRVGTGKNISSVIFASHKRQLKEILDYVRCYLVTAEKHQTKKKENIEIS